LIGLSVAAEVAGDGEEYERLMCELDPSQVPGGLLEFATKALDLLVEITGALLAEVVDRVTRRSDRPTPT
jgi:hypothetical protein